MWLPPWRPHTDISIDILRSQVVVCKNGQLEIKDSEPLS